MKKQETLEETIDRILAMVREEAEKWKALAEARRLTWPNGATATTPSELMTPDLCRARADEAIWIALQIEKMKKNQ